MSQVDSLQVAWGPRCASETCYYKNVKNEQL